MPQQQRQQNNIALPRPQLLYGEDASQREDGQHQRRPALTTRNSGYPLRAGTCLIRCRTGAACHQH